MGVEGRKRREGKRRLVLKALDPSPQVTLTKELGFPISPVIKGMSEFSTKCVEVWSCCSKSSGGYTVTTENLSQGLHPHLPNEITNPSAPDFHN